MIQSKKLYHLCIGLLFVGSLVFTECHTSNRENKPSDSTPPCVARLSGQYSKDIIQDLENTSAMVQLAIVDYFTEGYTKEISLNADGTFSIDIPIVCNTECQITLGGYYIIAFLSPGQETEFKLTKGISHKRNLNMIRGSGFTEEDIKEVKLICNDIIEKNRPDWNFKPGISTEVYQQLVINNLNEIKKEIDNNTELLYDQKQYLKNLLRMNYLYGWVLNSLNTDGKIIGALPQPLKNAYDFTFLKNFKLNDPADFYTTMYKAVLSKILETEVFHIPSIGDTPVEEWLKGVKSTLANLIGSDTGFFYDLLAANSYFLYLKKEEKPFSDKQVENMRAYFKNKIYIDVLLANNDKTIEFIKSNQKIIPNVPKEKLLNAIVSQYKGKVVVVDFWATWCQPCLKAMYGSEDMKERMAGKNKNVVFVYLAAPTSDKKEWKEIARNFKGAHYFIDTQDKWNYMMSLNNFSEIPTYLIYDTDSHLKNKFTGFPGNEKIQAIIEELLQ